MRHDLVGFGRRGRILGSSRQSPEEELSPARTIEHLISLPTQELSEFFQQAVPDQMVVLDPGTEIYPIHIPVIDEMGIKVSTAKFGAISPMHDGTAIVMFSVYVESSDGTGRFLGYFPHAKFVQTYHWGQREFTQYQVVSQE